MVDKGLQCVVVVFPGHTHLLLEAKHYTSYRLKLFMLMKQKVDILPFGSIDMFIHFSHTWVEQS